MSIEEKKKTLDILYYEIWMFNESFFQTGYVSIPATRCVIENNILLECYLLHARNIIDFLEDEKFENDIKCSDFNVKKIIIDLPPSNTKVEINKFLSHITKKRLNWEKPKWDCGKIRNIINDGLQKFFDQLDLSLFPTIENRNIDDFKNLIK